MNRSWRLAVAGVISAISASQLTASAFADSYYPAKVQMEVGSWRFTPVLRSESATTDSVHSMLAWKTSSEGPDSTIQAVWYIRDENERCQWNAKAWEAATPYDAMLAVKMSLNVDSSFDEDWPVSLSGGVVDPSKVGVTYAKGFFEGDTMAEFVNALPGAERDDAVQFLVEVGYAAADVSIEKKADREEVDPSQQLNAMAHLVEFAASQAPPPAPNHTVPSIPTPVPANWPGFPPGTVVPGAPSQFCQYWFGSGCFKVYFGWGPWTEGDWVPNGGIPLLRRCKYIQQVCRSRQVVEFCVQPGTGLIGVERTGYEQQCFENEGFLNMPPGGCPATVPDELDPLWPWVVPTNLPDPEKHW